MFRIWCEVWGGVTGSRASWLKVNGNEIYETPSREQAETLAKRINRKATMRCNFRYSVREV